VERCWGICDLVDVRTLFFFSLYRNTCSAKISCPMDKMTWQIWVACTVDRTCHEHVRRAFYVAVLYGPAGDRTWHFEKNTKKARYRLGLSPRYQYYESGNNCPPNPAHQQPRTASDTPRTRHAPPMNSWRRSIIHFYVAFFSKDTVPYDDKFSLSLGLVAAS